MKAVLILSVLVVVGLIGLVHVSTNVRADPEEEGGDTAIPMVICSEQYAPACGGSCLMYGEIGTCQLASGGGCSCQHTKVLHCSCNGLTYACNDHGTAHYGNGTCAKEGDTCSCPYTDNYACGASGYPDHLDGTCIVS